MIRVSQVSKLEQIAPFLKKEWSKVTGEKCSKKYFEVARGSEQIGAAIISLRPHNTVYLEELMIQDSERNHGTGTMLLDEIEKTVVNSGYERIVAETRETFKETILFYVARGFDLRHTIPSVYPDCPIKYIFVKELR